MKTFKLACLLLCPAFLHASTLSEALAKSAPDANPKAIEQALQASECATKKLGSKPAERLALIDYSRPSVERRFWIFDLVARKLLLSDYVAHGRGSGDNFAHAFSNVEGSLQSSLGLFKASERYVGAHGLSLRLDGLEPGVNDQARARAIVLHGAQYVDPKLGVTQGRIGRSHGCPAVRPAVADQVVNVLQGGQMLYVYYPDRQSALLRCDTPDSP